jgi:hypothetical protein
MWRLLGDQPDEPAPIDFQRRGYPFLAPISYNSPSAPRMVFINDPADRTAGLHTIPHGLRDYLTPTRGASNRGLRNTLRGIGKIIVDAFQSKALVAPGLYPDLERSYSNTSPGPLLASISGAERG